ncbi:MAG: NAD(+)/NADH kinase [Salinibacterium sp.]|nr:NAD(+)/NADH kinase [Salinibacterium sp.]
MTVSVGVLVNPIAGFGGTLAMHGTDELPAARFDEAVEANWAGHRMTLALDSFLRTGGEAEFVAVQGLLGATQLAAAGIHHRTLGSPPAIRRTTRADTIDAARRLLAEGVEVLLFAGGDGTATDIAEAIGTRMPVIGVPSGVKMHSEVFSRSPVGAGRLLADVILGRASSELAEVLDVGEGGFSGVVGMLLAPRSHEALQGAKTTTVGSGSSAARGIARELVAHSDNAVTWVIGPGTTAGAVGEELGFEPTLLGVDVVHPSGLVELDVDENHLFDVVSAAGHPQLVLGVVGGQGFLLGRGNQQLSTRVIDSIGVDRIHIVATAEKVSALFPPVLLLDVDTPSSLVGYRKVRTGSRNSTVMRVVDAAAQFESAQR